MTQYYFIQIRGSIPGTEIETTTTIGTSKNPYQALKGYDIVVAIFRVKKFHQYDTINISQQQQGTLRKS